MKKLILTVFVLAVFVKSNAQLTTSDVPKSVSIGKVRPAGVRLSELNYSITPTGDTLYQFSYKDKSYTAIDVWDNVFFKGGQQTLDDLYNLLKTAVDAEKKTEKAFKLGETDFLVITDASFGTKIVKLAITKKSGSIGLTDLTSPQINKLFGK